MRMEKKSMKFFQREFDEKITLRIKSCHSPYSLSITDNLWWNSVKLIFQFPRKYSRDDFPLLTQKLLSWEFLHLRRCRQ